MHGHALFQSVAVAALILANGFFVAAEFALVSLRRTRVDQMIEAKVDGASSVRRLLLDLDSFLSAVQLGVTLCSLALGWIGEPLAAGFFLDLLRGVPHAQTVAGILSATLGFALITYLHVLLGELTPKSLALRRVEPMAIAIAGPMLLFMAITRPALRFLQRSARAVLAVFGVPLTVELSAHSPEELKLTASATRRMELISPFQERLIHGSLELDEITVRQVMTPRQKIVSLPAEMLIEEASASINDHLHSRVPVYEHAPEHIVGIVYAKDVARLMHFLRTATTRSPNAPIAELRLRQIMRDVLMVPETKSVAGLMEDLQRRRRQIAIVVDEYGTTSGLVTAEDLIEQLTGEIEDEFDDPVRPILTTASGALLLEGSLNLRDLETQMQWSLPRDGDVETLAGFALTQLGRIPRPNESFVFDGRLFTITEMDGYRIRQMRVEPVPPASVASSHAADAHPGKGQPA